MEFAVPGMAVAGGTSGTASAGDGGTLFDRIRSRISSSPPRIEKKADCVSL